MHALADFHFLRPLALLLVLAVPLFWLLWRNASTQAGAWRAAVDAHLLPHLLERIDGAAGRSGLWLAAVLWTLASFALAGPAWEREPMPLYRNQARACSPWNSHRACLRRTRSRIASHAHATSSKTS